MMAALLLVAAGCGSEAAKVDNSSRAVFCRATYQVGENYLLDLMSADPANAGSLVYFEREARPDLPGVPDELKADWRIVHDAKVSGHKPEDWNRLDVRQAAARIDQWVTNNCVDYTGSLVRQTTPATLSW